MWGDWIRTVDLKKPFLLLSILRDVDVVDIVLDAQLLERTGDLLTVGRTGCVSVFILLSL